LISFLFILSFLFFSTTNLVAQDTDNDTVIDSLDLDDDNDGILDVVESLGFDPNVPASCAFPEAVFNIGDVTQVAGNAGTPFVGDQYRFSNVVSINAIPLDAVITIVEADANITTFTIDDDSIGNPDAWQASYNVPAGETAAMKFLIEFKVANTNAVVALDRFGGIFYDIDGMNANETIILSEPDFYAIENPTELTVLTDQMTGNVTFQGPLVTYPNVSLDTDIAMYFNYYNINSFTFSTTATNTTINPNSNLFSLLFSVCALDQFSDFSYVINNGI